MNAVQQTFLRSWIGELRSDHYRQIRGSFFGNDNGRCAVGVAYSLCDLALGIPLEQLTGLCAEELRQVTRLNDGNITWMVQPEAVRNWFDKAKKHLGLVESPPVVLTPIFHGGGKSFAEIADYLEDRYLRSALPASVRAIFEQPVSEHEEAECAL